MVDVRELQKLWMIHRDGALFVVAYVRVEADCVALLAYVGTPMADPTVVCVDGNQERLRTTMRLEFKSREVFETMDEAIACADFTKRVLLATGFTEGADDGPAFEP